MINDSTIELYIKNCSENDITAFEKLYEETKNIVFAYILSLAKDYHISQDILQDTYINIRCNASKYKPKGKPLAWIFKIAKNTYLMYIRKHNKVVYVDQKTDHNIINLPVKQDFESKILLDDAMKILSQKQRTVLFLHAVSGYKHREIADILGIPTGTALYTYNSAIKKVKEYIEKGSIICE